MTGKVEQRFALSHHKLEKCRAEAVVLLYMICGLVFGDLLGAIGKYVSYISLLVNELKIIILLIVVSYDG